MLKDEIHINIISIKVSLFEKEKKVFENLEQKNTMFKSWVKRGNSMSIPWYWKMSFFHILSVCVCSCTFAY